MSGGDLPGPSSPAAAPPAQPVAPGPASPPDLLVLHGVRVAGMADEVALAHRTGLEERAVRELLEGDEARGWVTHVDFAGTAGWTLTTAGRVQDGRRLAVELEQAGARGAVEGAHRGFEPLNAHLVRACTDWQLRPTSDDRLAVNDHEDPAWDDRILAEIAEIAGDLRPLVDGLTGALLRFAGYHQRFAVALTRASAGDRRWVAGVGLASCHGVWMELHEDLLSTLGIGRDAEPGRP